MSRTVDLTSSGDEDVSETMFKSSQSAQKTPRPKNNTNANKGSTSGIIDTTGKDGSATPDNVQANIEQERKSIKARLKAISQQIQELQ
ncbi:hypothetical protein SARC_17280, partial [Sphaeroforma arctica JP610]